MKKKDVSAQPLFNAIRNIVYAILREELKFNYFMEGKILTDNANGTYEVDINEQTYTIPSKDATTFIVGDIVRIMIPNSNFSEKYIECKKL